MLEMQQSDISRTINIKGQNELFEKKLQQYISDRNIQATHMVLKGDCHTVEQAAKTVGANVTDFVKNICFIDGNNNLVVAIVKGEDRVDTGKLLKILDIPKARKAKPKEILDKTGYLCGGIPSFGYNGIIVLDEKVLENPFVLTGGGTERSLVKITPSELIRVSNAKVCSIRV